GSVTGMLILVPPMKRLISCEPGPRPVKNGLKPNLKSSGDWYVRPRRSFGIGRSIIPALPPKASSHDSSARRPSGSLGSALLILDWNVSLPTAKLNPAPTDSQSFTLYAIEGLILAVTRASSVT